MAKLKVELNRAAVREQLLKSPEMQAICESHARAIVQRCGPGYEVKTKMLRERVDAIVYASTKEARKDNLANNTILKAVGG